MPIAISGIIGAVPTSISSLDPDDLIERIALVTMVPAAALRASRRTAATRGAHRPAHDQKGSRAGSGLGRGGRKTFGWDIRAWAH